ncbi:MAG: hypothetical protein ACYSWU_29270, partial [Planctomycetota bacterium]
FERKIAVTLPEAEPTNEVLASLWARAKVAHLMHKDLAGVQRGQPNPAMKEEILGLGLRYQLLTQFTSFVAVEHLRITEGDTVRTVPVPVEMPEGVSYEGVFGRGRDMFGVAFSANGRTLASAAGNRPTRAWNMSRPLMEKARREGDEPGSGPIADMLTKQLEAVEKVGKLDEAKKLVEQLVKLKLGPELQGLAEKVAKEGTDGDLTVDKIRVKKGRIEIRVQLAALSDQVLAKLKKLGFKELARAKSVKLLIGTIDVKQLEALAKLPEVRRIDPSL